LPDACPAAVTTARLPTDENILTAPFGDQPCSVEHGPAFAGGAVRGELVIVLVRGAESVESNHGKTVWNCLETDQSTFRKPLTSGGE